MFFPLWSILTLHVAHAKIQTLNTGVDSKAYKAYCPKNHFVSQLVLRNPRQRKNVAFQLTCEPFQANDNQALEHCKTKLRFSIPGADLRLGKHFHTCTCDEYLAGLSTYVERKKGKKRRMVNLRCCYASNKIMELESCYFTGLKYILTPWNTEIKTVPGRKPREAIQSISIIENYIQARVCKWSIVGRDIKSNPHEFERNSFLFFFKEIPHLVNKCEGVRKRRPDDIALAIAWWIQTGCYIPITVAPFGWTESHNSLVSERALKYRSNYTYGKQQHICRDGDYLYGFYKFIRKGPKGKDYAFFTRCHELTYTVCYCLWQKNCTSQDKPKQNTTGPQFNGAVYVAGWRSWWDKKAKRRKAEALCCFSAGLKLKKCKLSTNFTDENTRIVVNRPRYQFNADEHPFVVSGEVIHNIDQWYVDNELVLRFNICQVRGIESGNCAIPCVHCGLLLPPVSYCLSSSSATTTAVSTRKTSTSSTSTSTSTTSTSTTTSTTTSTSTSTSTSTTTTTTTTTPEPIFDFIFLFDESGSINQTGFDIEKQFLSTFAGLFTIEPGVTQTSLLRFKDEVTKEYDFTNYPNQDTAGVQKRINDMTYTDKGMTDITGSLEQSITIFNSFTARPNVNQVVLLLTDGRHNQGGDAPRVPAQTLRDNGIDIFAVAIGDNVNRDELDAVTGDANRVFPTTLANLQANAQNIKDLILANI